MAIQIRNTQSVQSSGPTNASVRTQAPASAFGSLEAQANQGVGSALQTALDAVSDAYEVREETDNLRIAKDLEREFVDFSNNLMYGDGTHENPGYLGLKGQHAVDAAADAAAQLQAFQDATLTRYEDNDRVTQLFTDSTSSRIDGSNIQIMTYTAQQRDVVTDQSSKAYKMMLTNESLNDHMNSDLIDGTLAGIAGEVAEEGIRKGTDPAVVAVMTQEQQSAYLLSLVKVAAASSTGDGVAILAENADLMTAIDVNAAEKAINIIRDADEADAKAVRIEDERLTDEAYDDVYDTLWLTQFNGEWDETAALAAVNNNTLRESDFDKLIRANAPSSGAATAVSADIRFRVEDAMYAGADPGDWRSRTDLTGEDKRGLLAVEKEISDFGGSWMASKQAQEARQDVEDALRPAGLDAFMVLNAEQKEKVRGGQAMLSTLIQGGMPPATARAVTLGFYAANRQAATAAALASLPPIIDFPGGTLPTTTQLRENGPAVLQAFIANTIKGEARLATLLSDGDITETRYMREMAMYEAYGRWHGTAVTEHNLSAAYIEMNEADQAAAEAAALLPVE